MSDAPTAVAIPEPPKLPGPEIPGAAVDEHGTFTFANGRTEVHENLPIEFPIAPLFDEEQPIDWLWPGRIPLGMVTFLEGTGSAGKTFVVLDMAAKVSRGAPWPGRIEGPQLAGDVLLVSGDPDGWERTILPRLASAHADLSRIGRCGTVQSYDRLVAFHHPERATTARSLSFPHDLPMLEYNIRCRPETRLVVIDSLAVFCAGERAFRETLRQLEEIAARRHVAIIVTARPTAKQARRWNPREADRRAENVRSVFRVLVDAEDESLRHLAPVRTSFCAEPEWLPFRIGPKEALGRARIAWGPPAEVPPESAIPPNPARDRAALRNQVMEWLTTVLGKRDMRVADVERESKRMGYSQATLRRAREALKVRMYWGPGGVCSEGWWTLRAEGDGPDIPPDSFSDGAAAHAGGHNGNGSSDEDTVKRREARRAPDVSPGITPNGHTTRRRASNQRQRRKPRASDDRENFPDVPLAEIPEAIWDRLRAPLVAAILRTAPANGESGRRRSRSTRHDSNGRRSGYGRHHANGRKSPRLPNGSGSTDDLKRSSCRRKPKPR